MTTAFKSWFGWLIWEALECSMDLPRLGTFPQPVWDSPHRWPIICGTLLSACCLLPGSFLEGFPHTSLPVPIPGWQQQFGWFSEVLYSNALPSRWCEAMACLQPLYSNWFSWILTYVSWIGSAVPETFFFSSLFPIYLILWNSPSFDDCFVHFSFDLTSRSSFFF